VSTIGVAAHGPLLARSSGGRPGALLLGLDQEVTGEIPRETRGSPGYAAAIALGGSVLHDWVLRDGVEPDEIIEAVSAVLTE